MVTKNKEAEEWYNDLIKKSIKTEEEARQYAIDWQQWQANQSLSYGEMLEWQTIFKDLAKRFDLVDEFKENGII